MIPLAVFVKTPGLSPIKTRLAQEIGKERAEKFYRLCCRWTQMAINEAKTHSSIHPFWAVAEKEGMESPFWETYEKIYQGEGSLGERLHCVYEELIQRFGSALVMGADSPELDPKAIVSAVNQITEKPSAQFVLGKTPDGGFYLFGGNCNLKRTLWTSITYSENTTAQQLKNAIATLGPVRELPSCADVDYFDDLREVMTRLKITDPQRYSELLPLNFI